MLLTPKLDRKRVATQGITTAGRSSVKMTDRSSIMTSGSTQSMEKSIPISKMAVSLTKKAVGPNSAGKYSSPKKPNINNFRPSTIAWNVDVQSKMSTQPHGVIEAYGISTYKGFRNVSNPHHMGVHLGVVKNLMLVEGYDGSVAGKYIKQAYPIELIRLMGRETRQKPQLFAKEAFERVQQQLCEKQRETGDNSGASLASVIIDGRIVTTMNVGASQVICYTKNSSLLRLNEQHTTDNKKELQRVIQKGGRVYRTVVSVPQEQNLMIEGPIRMAPSGLVFTRTLGKTMAMEAERRAEEEERPKKKDRILTSQPEVSFVQTEEISWLGIFSESVISHLSHPEIQEIINSERLLRSSSHTDHHIAMESSRRIVERVISEGTPDAISAMVFIFDPSPFSSAKVRTPRPINLQLRKKNKRMEVEASLFNRPVSLKYIGARKSFVKAHINSERPYN